jgi:Signal peptidase (SPase) II
VRAAAVGLGSFTAAFAVDLLTKSYFVAHKAGPHSVVYNQRPHDLVLRIDVSLLTLAVVYVLAVVARRRGIGRLWGAWIGVGVLLGGTLGNGVSSYVWARGVPDFIHVSGGWVWNVADFEIVVGLLGAAASVVVSAAAAYVRGLRRPRAV